MVFYVQTLAPDPQQPLNTLINNFLKHLLFKPYIWSLFVTVFDNVVLLKISIQTLHMPIFYSIIVIICQ